MPRLGIKTRCSGARSQSHHKVEAEALKFKGSLDYKRSLDQSWLQETLSPNTCQVFSFLLKASYKIIFKFYKLYIWIKNNFAINKFKKKQ